MKLGVISELHVSPRLHHIEEFYAPLTEEDFVVLHGGAKHFTMLKDEMDHAEVVSVEFRLWSHVDPNVTFFSRQFMFRNQQIVDNADLMLFIVARVYDDLQHYDVEVRAAMEYAFDNDVPYVVKEGQP